MFQPRDGQRFKQRGKAVAGFGPGQLHHAHPVLWALRTWRRGMQNGSILTGVQMSPFPLRLMIVEWAEGAAFRTSPLRFLLGDEVDVHLTLLQFEFYPLHLPRGFNTQDASIEFVILHGCDFPRSGAPFSKGAAQVGQWWYPSGFSCFLRPSPGWSWSRAGRSHDIHFLAVQ